MTDSREFHLEVTRREIRACNNLDDLKEITLQCIDLLEGQRKWFLKTIADGWLKDAA